jgi:hypothetical protein
MIVHDRCEARPDCNKNHDSLLRVGRLVVRTHLLSVFLIFQSSVVVKGV